MTDSAPVDVARVELRIKPGARVTKFGGWFGEMPRLSVAAPAVDGKANAEVVRAVARLIGVRERDVRIVGGLRARTKRLEITGASLGSVQSALVAAAGPRTGGS